MRYKNKESLTPEEEALMGVVRQEWLDRIFTQKGRGHIDWG